MLQPSYSHAQGSGLHYKQIHQQLLEQNDSTMGNKYPYFQKLIGQKKASHFSSLDELMEQEPNNDFSQANPIHLEDFMTGTFAKDDVDVYQIDLETADRIVVIGTGNAPINIDFLLYDQDGNAIEPVESGTYKDSEVTGSYGGFELEAGTYYISAIDKDNNASDSTYELFSFSESNMEEEVMVERIAGEDRYETAVQISNYAYPEGSKNVVLASDTQFPDALSGAPLAQKLQAPILLTKKDGLPGSVKDEIERLGAKKVTILGGKNAISPLVESQLKEMGLTLRELAVLTVTKHPL
jgi:hypothetical protein